MWKVFRKGKSVDPDEFLVLKAGEFKEKLVSEGFDEKKVNEILYKLSEELNEQVKEKSILSYDEFFDVVSQAIEGLYNIPTERIQIASELSKFVECNAEVSNSVILYASYIVYGAAETQLDEYKVVLSADDTEVVEKAQEVISEWEKQSKIRRYIYMCAKDLVVYGDAYLEKIYDANKRIVGVAYIPATTMIPKLKPSGVPEKYYQIVEKKGKFADFSIRNIATLLSEKKVIEFEPHEIIHFNDGSPIGMSDSPIKSLLVQWRFLKLLEESLVIHRVTRARRFIIFFLDVTGKTKKQIRNAIQNFTRMIKRVFRLDLEEGEEEGLKSNIPLSADLVIPIAKGSATRVQAIPSDPSATKVDDLKFYTHRVTTNLLTSHIFSPERTGKEQFVEKAFMRKVRIYQKQMSYTLEDLYRQVLFERGFKDVDVSVVFPSPDTTEEIKIIDSVVRRMMVVNQLIATTGIVPPTSWIIDYVFKDMTQLEVKQLVKMLQYAQQQQEEAATGEEYPSLFSGVEELLSTGEEEEQEKEEKETEKSETQHLTLNISEKILKDAFNSNRMKVLESKKVVDNLTKTIELTMRYLQMVKEEDKNA